MSGPELAAERERRYALGMAYCPECRRRYPQSEHTCPRCRVTLVDVLTPEASPAVLEGRQEERDEYRVVGVYYGHWLAHLAAALLESADIPYLLKEGAEYHLGAGAPSTIYVRSADLTRARELLTEEARLVDESEF